MTAEEREILDNARRWWETRRPDNWDLAQHLAHPTHRTVGCVEEELAKSVARLIRKQRGDLL